jgi:hypothetical protein
LHDVAFARGCGGRRAQSGAGQVRRGSIKNSVFRSSRYLWAIGAALIVITLVGCGVTIWDLHRQTIQQNRVAVTNLSVVLAEQTSRYVQVVDLALQEVQSRVATSRAATPAEFVAFFNNDATRVLLRERLTNLPQANAFFLIESDGRVLVTSRAQPPPNPDMSDRDY